MGFVTSESAFAAIDIGSHTLRMIIAGVEEERVLKPLRLERRITRLARNFQQEGRLSRQSREHTLAALREFAELARQHGAIRGAFGATGVVRRAINGVEFVREAEQTVGFPGSILSEEEEALVSARGVLSVLPVKRWPILTFDLGGSTTEFLLIDDRERPPVWSTSVFVGAATLTESWIHGDPPDSTSIEEAVAAARSALQPTFETVRSLLGCSAGEPLALQLVGTAGTVTTLAAMQLGMTHYDPYRVNGLIMKREWIHEIAHQLGRASLSERRGIPGLEPGREDIIFGGAVIVREIVLGLLQNEITITDGGLLEGLLLDLVERSHQVPQPLETLFTWRFE